MNGITQVVFVLTLWLVMGLGFLSAATEVRRLGKTWAEAWTSYEGLLFIVSVIIPLIILLHRNISF